MTDNESLKRRAQDALIRILKGCEQMRSGNFVMSPDSLVQDIAAIDQWLTGSTTCRSFDMDDARDCCDGDTWIVYLSDGGYTRLVIDPASETQTIRITGGPSASWKERVYLFRMIGGMHVV